MTAPKERPVAADPLLADRENSRSLAAGVITKWLISGDFPDRLVDTIDQHRAFLMEVVYGVARRRRTLDWAIAPWVARRPALDVQACLYVGAYQLLFMDTVAPHAAVNETVSSAKLVGGAGIAGFVNHALRRVADNAAILRDKLAAQPLGVRESFPDLLVNRWTDTFGPEGAAALCAWHNVRPPVVLRLDRRRTNATDFLAQLRAAGVEAAPHPFRPDLCLTLPSGVSVPQLPGFADGLFVIQDPSTLLAVEMLAPQPGERILDACAAPGGKAMLIAERLNGTGELIALDLHADRLNPLHENLARMRAPATVLKGDARDPDLVRLVGDKPFDRILADVPCTNTGVLRRRPDARWRFTSARLTAQSHTQTAILENLIRLLKPGGTLVYSTCSLEPEENSQLVKPWANRHPECKFVGKDLLFPPDSQTDGAFAALIRKRA
ncbi:MAG: 16S rRNA (cytosine(967)-C(5))-methyltransferase RsmB [Lentisphaerae bacterium]|nr:16S rRNA (cytosine(967)-C(5))-methyltransferase RsmB [Lentisphaerota bacterium]